MKTTLALICSLLLSARATLSSQDTPPENLPHNTTENNNTGSSKHPSVVWLTDYQEALHTAAKTQRHVLVYFTGSDWCGWCVRLKKEILDTKEFKKYAQDKLVLLEIDFPRRKQLPPAQQEANKKLKEKFGVQGYPTLFLLNPDGKTIRELGYLPGGPKAFISELQSAEG